MRRPVLNSIEMLVLEFCTSVGARSFTAISLVEIGYTCLRENDARALACDSKIVGMSSNHVVFVYAMSVVQCSMTGLLQTV